MSDFNKLQAQGKIMLMGRDKMARDNITILVTRPISKKKDWFRFALRDPISPEIRHGDRVCVEGHTNAYHYKDEQADQWVHVQQFIADTVKPQPTRGEQAFGIKTKFYKPASFEAYYQGEILMIRYVEGKKWGRLVVRTPETKTERASTIELRYDMEGRLPSIKNMKRGDKVCVIASGGTYQKEENGRNVTVTDLYVDDIAVVEEGKEAENKEQVTAPDPALQE